MMEMDDLNSSKCQKSRRRDIDGINKIVNDDKTNLNSCLLKWKAKKRERDAVAGIFWF